MTDKQVSLFPDTIPSDTLKILHDLDRSEVEPLAYKILNIIEPFVEKAQIAGSIRRYRGKVNDIDIVVQPKPQCWINIIKEVRSEFDAITEKQGPKLATLYVPFMSQQGGGHVQLDLFRAEKNTYGIVLLVRTGSIKHNVYLCNLALNKGLRLQYSQGLVDQSGQIVAAKTEEEVFAALALPFISPQDREIKEG